MSSVLESIGETRDLVDYLEVEEALQELFKCHNNQIVMYRTKNPPEHILLGARYR